MADTDPLTDAGVVDVGDAANAGSDYTEMPEATDYVDRETSTLDFLTYALPSVAAGIVDTFGTSLNLIDEGDVAQGLEMASPGLANYYKQNRSGVGIAADLASMWIPGGVAMKAFRSGTYLNRLVKPQMVPGLAQLVAKGRDSGRIGRLVARRNASLANRGAFAFTDEAFDQSGFVKKFAAFDNLNRRLQTAAVVDGVKQGVAFELGVLATMNNSETIYPEEFGLVDHLALASLGVALPAGFEGLMARAAIRRQAAGFAFKGNQARNVLDLETNDIIFRPNERGTGIALLSAQEGAQRSIVNNTATDKVLAQNLDREANQLGGVRKQQIEKMAEDTIPVAKEMGWKKSYSAGHVDTFMRATMEDPTLAMGAVTLRSVPEDSRQFSKLATSIERAVGKLQAQANELKQSIEIADAFDPAKAGNDLAELADVEEKLTKLDSLQMFVVKDSGEATLATGYRPQYYDLGNKPLVIQAAVGPLPDRYGDISTEGLYLGSKGFDDLTHAEKSQNFAAMDQAADAFIRAKKVTQLSSSDHWTRFDWALEVFNRNPDLAKQNIRLPEEWAGNWNAVKLASLNKKFPLYRQMVEKMGASAGKPARGSIYPSVMPSDIRYQLNLPDAGFGQPSPIEQLFTSMMVQGDTDFIAGLVGRVGPSLKLAKLEVTDALPYFNAVEGLAKRELTFPDFDLGRIDPAKANKFLQSKVSLTGSSLSPSKRPAVMLVKERVDADGVIRGERMLELAASHRANVLDMLSKAEQNGAGLIARVVNRAMGASDSFRVSGNVNSLAEGGLAGRQRFVQGTFAQRDLPTMQAMHNITTITDKAGIEHLTRLFEPVNDKLSKIRSAAHETDMLAFSNFVQSRRFGWELTADSVKLEEGKFGLKLDMSDADKAEKNRKIWDEVFGGKVDMPDPEEGDILLPSIVPASRQNPEYIPVAMTQLASEVADGMRTIGLDLRQNANYLRKVLGNNNQLNRQEWWVPPINFSKQHVAYIIDESNNVRAVSGHTQRELDQLLQTDRIKQLIDRPGSRLYTQEEIGNYARLHDRAFFDLIDMSDPFAQTGKNTGASGSPTMITGRQALDDMVASLQKQVISLTRRSRAALYEPQIMRAKMLHEASGFTTPGGQASVWQTYLDNMLGQSAINRKGDIGWFYKGFEDKVDEKLSQLQQYWQGATKQVPKITRSDQKSFDKLQKELGEYTPFQSTVEYMETTFNVAAPPQMKNAMAFANQAASLMILRMFEVAHSLLNFGGVVATMPAVMSALKRMPGEAPEAHAARINFFGDVRGTNGLAEFSPMKAFATSIHDAWTAEGKKIIADAERRGLLDQEVAEIARTIHFPQQTASEGFFRKLADRASYLSDKSEKISRTWAHLAGHRIAKKALGIVGEEEAQVFAHRFANQVIGDYRAINRPQVFQGAVGLPLGLFQTYMWNYFQRMFSYIENKQMKVLATQYAMQTAVFGLESVPGWQQFYDHFATSYDGSVDPVTALQQSYGEGADWLLYGSFSNLPKLFGADDGVSIFTRGDAGITRIPAFLSPGNAPFVQVAKRIGNAINQSVDMFMQGGQVSTQRAMEILATNSVNRPFRGMMELAANSSTDNRGQLIAGDVRDALSVAARVSGLKPLREAEQANAYYRTRQFEYSQWELRDRLNKSFRAKIRGNEVDGEGIRQALVDYYRSGGNPAYFAQWLRDAYTTSLVTRNDRKFLEVLKGGKLSDILRLGGADVAPIE